MLTNVLCDCSKIGGWAKCTRRSSWSTLLFSFRLCLSLGNRVWWWIHGRSGKSCLLQSRTRVGRWRSEWFIPACVYCKGTEPAAPPFDDSNFHCLSSCHSRNSVHCHIVSVGCHCPEERRKNPPWHSIESSPNARTSHFSFFFSLCIKLIVIYDEILAYQQDNWKTITVTIVTARVGYRFNLTTISIRSHWVHRLPVVRQPLPVRTHFCLPLIASGMVIHRSRPSPVTLCSHADPITLTSSYDLISLRNLFRSIRWKILVRFELILI